MSNIWIVLQSEFTRRIRSKAFIITTLLGPLLLIGFMGVIGFVSVKSYSNEKRTIAVVDETGVLLPRLLSRAHDQYELVPADGDAAAVRSAVLAGTYDGYLVLPQGVLADEAGAVYYAVDGSSVVFQTWLRQQIAEAVREERLAVRQVDPEVLALLETDVALQSLKLSEAGETAGNTEAYLAVGFIMGLLIYMAMLIYGSVVMQGVIEEKSNRVVEVVISSVRPFHLLMGKVLGIGAMGLVQMITWSALMMGLTVYAGALVALFIDPSRMNLPEGASQEQVMEAVDFAMPALSPIVFVSFVLFFLLGYLLYASLFAAVGSAVEQQQDAQGLLLPVMMPIIVSFAFLQPTIENPDSTLALVLSLVPFTAPVTMAVRVAVASVPLWQVALSFVLLVLTFIGCIWMSSRIYRVGILMYGKKPGLKDLARWVRYA